MRLMTFLRRLFRKKESFPLTVVYIDAPESGGYIAYFEKFPDTYAQGKTKKETLYNLYVTLKAVLESEQEEARMKSARDQKQSRESVDLHMAI